MRNLADTLAQIFRTLWAHKLRSFLTMFGIAWGIGSLLLLVCSPLALVCPHHVILTGRRAAAFRGSPRECTGNPLIH